MIKKFWKPITALTIFIIMQLIAGVFATIAMSAWKISQADALSIALIMSSIVTIALLKALHIIRWKAFSSKNIRWNYIPIALAAALLGIFAMDLILEQLSLPDMLEMQFSKMAKTPLGIIAIVFAGPIVEELVFREGIIGPLIRHRVHRWQAIFVSALAFGVIHLNPAQVPFAFIMGVILGIIYTKTGNILTSGFIHILNNALAVIEINILGEHFEEFRYAEILGGKLITWGYIFVSSFLCYVFLRQFWLKYHRQ